MRGRVVWMVGLVALLALARVTSARSVFQTIRGERWPFTFPIEIVRVGHENSSGEELAHFLPSDNGLNAVQDPDAKYHMAYKDWAHPRCFDKEDGCTPMFTLGDDDYLAVHVRWDLGALAPEVFALPVHLHVDSPWEWVDSKHTEIAPTNVWQADTLECPNDVGEIQNYCQAAPFVRRQAKCTEGRPIVQRWDDVFCPGVVMDEECSGEALEAAAVSQQTKPEPNPNVIGSTVIMCTRMRDVCLRPGKGAGIAANLQKSACPAGERFLENHAPRALGETMKVAVKASELARFTNARGSISNLEYVDIILHDNHFKGRDSLMGGTASYDAGGARVHVNLRSKGGESTPAEETRPALRTYDRAEQERIDEINFEDLVKSAVKLSNARLARLSGRGPDAIAQVMRVSDTALAEKVRKAAWKQINAYLLSDEERAQRLFASFCAEMNQWDSCFESFIDREIEEAGPSAVPTTPTVQSPLVTMIMGNQEPGILDLGSTYKGLTTSAARLERYRSNLIEAMVSVSWPDSGERSQADTGSEPVGGLLEREERLKHHDDDAHGGDSDLEAEDWLPHMF